MWRQPKNVKKHPCKNVEGHVPNGLWRRDNYEECRPKLFYPLAFWKYGVLKVLKRVTDLYLDKQQCRRSQEK